MAQSFKVVPPGLLATEMGVDAHISCGARQRLSLSVGDMLFSLRVSILFGHAEVYHVYNVRCPRVGATDQEIVRLDVPIDEILLVDRLDSGKLLAVNTEGIVVQKGVSPSASQP